MHQWPARFAREVNYFSLTECLISLCYKHDNSIWAKDSTVKDWDRLQSWIVITTGKRFSRCAKVLVVLYIGHTTTILFVVCRMGHTAYSSVAVCPTWSTRRIPSRAMHVTNLRTKRASVISRLVLLWGTRRLETAKVCRREPTRRLPPRAVHKPQLRTERAPVTSRHVQSWGRAKPTNVYMVWTLCIRYHHTTNYLSQAIKITT
jgi:hypothetical protein